MRRMGGVEREEAAIKIYSLGEDFLKIKTRKNGIIGKKRGNVNETILYCNKTIICKQKKRELILEKMKRKRA